MYTSDYSISSNTSNSVSPISPKDVQVPLTVVQEEALCGSLTDEVQMLEDALARENSRLEALRKQTELIESQIADTKKAEHAFIVKNPPDH